MSPQAFVLRSLEQAGAFPPPYLLSLSPGTMEGSSYSRGGTPYTLLGTCQPWRSLMNWLCVPPPDNPIPPSPAPAWLGRCEGSDFTACQLRPKNTQHSEMLGQGEERAGTRDGVVGAAMVPWPEKPS